MTLADLVFVSGQLAADICMQVAEHHEGARDMAKAVVTYQEALGHDETSARAMLALAKLHMRLGDLDAAQFQLLALLKGDKSNADANVVRHAAPRHATSSPSFTPSSPLITCRDDLDISGS